MQDFYFLQTDCLFVEALETPPPPLLTSVPNTSTMGDAVGDGYTPTLFPSSPIMILTFMGLPCDILTRNKGDNKEDSTTAEPQLPSLFPPQ